MQIYLPIAEMPVNVFLVLLLGGVTGVLSGMFGVGGGFLMTPFLIFIGVPPAIAVSSSANQIIASSFSGFMAHWKRNNVDFRMGIFLLFGGMIGSTLGVGLFALLKSLGQIDLVISLTYVFFLGLIGSLMGIESFKTYMHKRKGISAPAQPKINWFHALPLPWKTDFPRSNLHISRILPLVIGFVTGIMVSIMGIGGGFIMIPAMLYILGMPTSVVIGTSLFQIIFITANVTFLQALNTHTVDIVLALLLLTSSVIGAQFGTRIGVRLSSEHIRGLLALIVLAVALKLALGLFVEPANLYEVIELEKAT
ncbi:MAG: permease [Rickettsiales bacterium]|jgi:uncharacterized membrane protein YfcA|nr:permease [Rickettsiales bacterium]